MPRYHILYNPKAASGEGMNKAGALKNILTDGELLFHNITDINISDFIASTKPDEKIVVSGGDGTISRFVNEIYEDIPERELFYHASGSGNDFAKDIGLAENSVTSLAPYLKNLPTVYVKGIKHKFINGIGYGIDGYCCEEGEKLREKGKGINYTTIAIKGLLFFFRRTKATVTVDGVTKTYKNVWMIPTMFGRYYGGGMMACPLQTRENKDGSLSVMAVHSKSKLKLLYIFPRIFTGKHINFKSVVETLTGHEITVAFDHPTALQIDGEVVTEVLSYTVKSAKILNAEKSRTKEMV
ncbi:MAG: diacylglycerol kinase family protein [Clostridia bacterium]|nr:diacylglycerol kinase family protein [Clostridia bacterium]